MLLLDWKYSLAVIGLLCAAAEEDVGDEFLDEALRPEQLRKLHAKLDADGDGKAGLSEMMRFAKDIQFAIARKDMPAMMEEIDLSKDGTLSLDEHMTDLHNQADGGDESEMRDLEERKRLETEKFHAADTNHDGTLDSDELPSLFYPEVNEEVLTIVTKGAMQQKDTNKDGKLSAREFWETDPDESENDDNSLAEEERADFAKLDLNGDGMLDAVEVRAWESGHFHTEEALKKLLEVADKDHDMHVTAQELAEASAELSGSESSYHLIEWIGHHEL